MDRCATPPARRRGRLTLGAMVEAPDAVGERGPLRLLSKPARLRGHVSPHRKEGIEGMIRTAVHVGIDVAKDFVDVAIGDDGECFRVTTDTAGLDALACRVSGFGPGVVVGLEASGGYERPIIRRLHEAGIAVRLVDPARVRQFARAMGIKAKNDRLDAAVIAAFVATVDGALNVAEPARERLCEHVRYRRQLMEALTVIDNQARLTDDAGLEALAAERRELLRRQVDEIEHRIVRLIDADPAMSKTFALLRSVPGVGPVLAWTLIAEMPELGSLDRWKVAALAGVAPFDRDSGGHNGKRMIHGGRANVRKVLYMAAVAAARCNPPIQAFHQRLRDQGKPPKVAITACMRKLLITLNAIARDQVEWKPAI